VQNHIYGVDLVFPKVKSAIHTALVLLIGLPMMLAGYAIVVLAIVVAPYITVAAAMGLIAAAIRFPFIAPVLVATIVSAIVLANRKSRQSARMSGGTAACEYVLKVNQVLRDDNGELPGASVLMPWIQAIREAKAKPVCSGHSDTCSITTLYGPAGSGYDDSLLTMQRFLSHRCRQGREAEALADFAAFVRHLNENREEVIREWAEACPTPVAVVPARIAINHGSFDVDSFIQDILDERFELWLESDEGDDTAAQDAPCASELQLTLF
jgi:hypothetical protein